MGYIVSTLLCLLWGALMGSTDLPAWVSLPIALVGGFAIGWFVPPLIGV